MRLYLKKCNKICEIHPTNLSQVILDRFYKHFSQMIEVKRGKLSLKDSEIIYDRMEKNWIDLGRNPRGLYGASLLLSCNMHGEETGIQKVADTSGRLTPSPLVSTLLLVMA